MFQSICVGKHVAVQSIFVDIAMGLWAFSLANAEGQTLDADAIVDEGVVMCVNPYAFIHCYQI